MSVRLSLLLVLAAIAIAAGPQVLPARADEPKSAGDGSRLQLKLYPGGHMNYSRDASRAALRADAMKLYSAD